MANPIVVAARIEALLKSRYRQAPGNESEKALDAAHRFWLQILGGRLSKKSLLQEAAELIHRYLMFRSVCFIMKDHRDGLYRYHTIIGFTKDAEESMRHQVYSEAEMMAADRLPKVIVSKLIDFVISEAPPKAGEEMDFNRPTMVTVPRNTEDEFTEGDFMNILIRGWGDELMGLIEVNEPRDGKLPSGDKMKGLELLATMIGVALQRHEINHDRPGSR